MARELILIVEDDCDIQELLSFNLKREGYSVLLADSGEDGLKSARAKLPDLILLDLMLPGADGLEVCRALQTDDKTRHIPVIMLTAKGEDIDIVTGLEVGATDYVVKPFSPKVLIARIRNALRRKSRDDTEEDTVTKLAELTIDHGRYEVTADGKPLDLTPTEFQILLCLGRRPGWVFSRYQIVNEVRGEDTIITDRAVDVQIAGLRKKLGEYGNYIETVRGVGYRFREL
jgi:two-component system alkaline phosphatase synthesis response regulator PhoP